jgi:hypothetical protein
MQVRGAGAASKNVGGPQWPTAPCGNRRGGAFRVRASTRVRDPQPRRSGGIPSRSASTTMSGSPIAACSAAACSAASCLAAACSAASCSAAACSAASCLGADCSAQVRSRGPDAYRPCSLGAGGPQRRSGCGSSSTTSSTASLATSLVASGRRPAEASARSAAKLRDDRAICRRSSGASMIRRAHGTPAAFNASTARHASTSSMMALKRSIRSYVGGGGVPVPIVMKAHMPIPSEDINPVPLPRQDC